MKDIFNPYLSNDEKEILIEIMRLEEVDATLSDYAAIFALSTVTSALPGQINAIAEPVSASG